MTIQTYLNTLQLKGYLAYEYNPFFNYQTKDNLIEINGFLIPEGKAVDKRNGKVLILENGNWKDFNKNTIDNEYVLSYEEITTKKDVVTNELLYREGDDYNIITKDSLINLDTYQLNFDINHPIDIEVLPSYDGSVNLILNDDKNTPRLINSRFSPREKNTYEIVDRIGENDTNIYSSDTFEKDTSLYFLYRMNPKIQFKKFVSGVLPVGLYCFYFTYCDSDNNESDFIGESGLIPVFVGLDGDPYSIDGGIKNLLSNKGICLQLSKLDSSYNYLKVYYVRYFADYQQNRVYECKKVYLKYFINSNKMTILITGNEEAEDLDPNILNLTRFNAKSILTQALCKNMLFFGNIVKNYDNYKELLDCALRIVPKCVADEKLGFDKSYSESFYYKAYNMYSKVGYFNNEYYRFGVVFMYENGTLSNVYNTLGYDMNKDLTYDSSLFEEERRKYIQIDDEGWIINKGEFSGDTLLNSRGVCKIINNFENNENNIIKIKFEIPGEVKDYLSSLGIRGLFFVRQKRIPNILGQCYILPVDNILHAPILKVEDEYKTESFVTLEKTEAYKRQVYLPLTGQTMEVSDTRVLKEGLLVNNTYLDRLYNYGSTSNIGKNAYAAICPDFLLNQPYYNQIFNGAKFKLLKVTTNAGLMNPDSDRYYVESDSNMNFTDKNYQRVTICTVTEDVPTVALNKSIFKLEIGKAEEAYRFGYAQKDNGTYNAGDEDFDKINNSTNIVRGKYSPYLAILGTNLKVGELYNIYLDSYSDSNLLYLNRMNSSEPFYAISDRYNWDEFDVEEREKSDGEQTTTTEFLYKYCFRGDCYLNTFTYRLNRNFNDSSLPNNDDIIDKKTWKDHYRANNPEEFKNISRSDINAVLLGSWVTIEVKSAYNYALRSEDFSYVSEAALMGSPRTFYPRRLLMWLGNYKMPDSYLYNDAYRANLGYKCYFTLLDVNYIKNTFSNRILYSAMAIQDSFKNNYRESYSTYFRDYSLEYGSIQRLIGFEGYLLVIFEHAIGVAVINERVLAGNGDGEPVFINTGNVLPEELTIVTDTYGTQWPESVVKSEAGYVYGVDTIAKKIWRVKGQLIEILSDFKVNKFLSENITLGERELYPIVGIKNVKTHYNNNKKDIMFTFYDDIYQDEEKVWNLCYNELLGEFITFYSWIPSYSENIDTQFFSFDRKTSKALSLLDTTNYANFSNTGVLLNSPILQGKNEDWSTEIYYRDPSTKEIINGISYKILPDHWGYYNYFNINTNNKGKRILSTHEYTNLCNLLKNNKTKVIILYVLPYSYSSSHTEGGSIKLFKSQLIALSFDVSNLTTDFYLHGKAGIFNILENLYPTYWYGEYHPFEFEFVVNDKIGQLKIFNNLVLISNKAEPESFHFEIEGDNYEFSSDKRSMYFRQEATKNVYLNLGSDILYDRSYTDVIADPYTHELYYRGNPTRRNESDLDSKEYVDLYKKFDRVYPIESEGLVLQVKSTIFPLYYERVDTYNDIYYIYRGMLDNIESEYDFKNLSGSEIKWHRDLNQFNIVTHIKNNPIPLVGRLRGNSYYKEGKWHVLIPSIIFNLKNEGKWGHTNNDFILDTSQLDGENTLASYLSENRKEFDLPPLVVNSTNIPLDIKDDNLTYKTLPNIYKATGSEWLYNIDTNNWTYRKEAKIRDKWMKVRVRYSGKNLAIIHSVITLYNISYA